MLDDHHNIMNVVRRNDHIKKEETKKNANNQTTIDQFMKTKRAGIFKCNTLT